MCDTISATKWMQRYRIFLFFATNPWMSHCSRRATNRVVKLSSSSAESGAWAEEDDAKLDLPKATAECKMFQQWSKAGEIEEAINSSKERNVPFSLINWTYAPTYFTIRSAVAGPFFTGKTRLIISMNTSPNARSPMGLTPAFEDFVIAAALTWSLYRVTQFFLWLAIDDWAWSNSPAIVSCRSSRTLVDLTMRDVHGEGWTCDQRMIGSCRCWFLSTRYYALFGVNTKLSHSHSRYYGGTTVV